jgi:N-acetylmuramic acid 6-phosphate etherase
MSKNTEKINTNTSDLDLKTSDEFVQCFIDEEKTVIEALSKAKEQIANVIEEIYVRIKSHNEVYIPYSGGEDYFGPRIYYFGAGTSGRIGVLDASECPPTFSAHPEMFNGVIAGGTRAITSSVENAEDNALEAETFIKKNLTENDIVIGISANGNAAFVKAALESARKMGVFTVAIANNEDAQIFNIAKEKIFLDTGAEIITGSTRLKAGTVQKIVLNIISTGLMVKLGKVYGNLMVDVQAKNKKLKERAANLVMKVCECSEQEASKALLESSYKVKDSIVMINKKLSALEAKNLLERNAFNLRSTLEE